MGPFSVTTSITAAAGGLTAEPPLVAHLVEHAWFASEKEVTVTAVHFVVFSAVCHHQGSAELELLVDELFGRCDGRVVVGLNTTLLVVRLLFLLLPHYSCHLRSILVRLVLLYSSIDRIVMILEMVLLKLSVVDQD